MPNDRSASRPGQLAALCGLLVCASAPLAQAETTPIKHVIVAFQENTSFDHYFGTYPKALNLAGEKPFHAAPGTPSVNGLSDALLLQNANKANPVRLDPKQAATCDMDHDYTPEQQAFNGGLMNKFIDTPRPIPTRRAATPTPSWAISTATR
jgi:phospholipase C